MTVDELLKIYAEPVGDGLYDVWGLDGQKVAENVDRRRAVLIARQLEDRHTGADLGAGLGPMTGWSSGRRPIRRSH